MRKAIIILIVVAVIITAGAATAAGFMGRMGVFGSVGEDTECPSCPEVVECPAAEECPDCPPEKVCPPCDCPTCVPTVSHNLVVLPSNLDVEKITESLSSSTTPNKKVAYRAAQFSGDKAAVDSLNFAGHRGIGATTIAPTVIDVATKWGYGKLVSGAKQCAVLEGIIILPYALTDITIVTRRVDDAIALLIDDKLACVVRTYSGGTVTWPTLDTRINTLSAGPHLFSIRFADTGGGFGAEKMALKGKKSDGTFAEIDIETIMHFPYASISAAPTQY